MTARDTPTSAEATQRAWDLTRQLATRRYVHVMKPEADGVIRANNYPRLFPVVGHAAPDAPWTVDLTDEQGRFWLAPFDLDAKSPDDFPQAAEDLGVLVRLLRELRIPFVACKSSPTGGYHVFLGLAGVGKPVMEALAAAAGAVLPSLDWGLLVNDRAGAVRPPGTPHRRGGHSEVIPGEHDVDVLLERSVTDADLLRLVASFRELRPEANPADERTAGPVDAGHRPHRDLPAWGVDALATVDGGRDPSRTAYRCLLAMAIAGWSIADVARAVTSAPGLEHFRTRNNPSGPRTPRAQHEAASRLERQWAKAQDWAVREAYAPHTGPERDISELRSIVDTVDGALTSFRVSPGRWSSDEAVMNDATVLTALGWMTVRSGQRDVAAALRSVAALTGIPSSTVDRSLRRLRRAGWVQLRRATDGPNAAVYRLSDRFSTVDEHDGPLQNVNARPPEQIFDVRSRLMRELDDRVEAGRHDVFTRAGLGPTARRVFEALTEDERAPEDVADAAGLPRGRTRAAFARLRRHGLAILSKSGWRRRARDYRGRAAKILGIAGILRRREQQYTDERTLWAWWNADLARHAGRSPGKRTATPQDVMFRFYDERGGPEDWPAYPRGADGRGDHRYAWRYVTSGTLQQLRDTELEVAA